jgi:hypothetical protein
MAARALASVMLGGGMKLGRKDKTKSKEAKAKAKAKETKGGKAKEAEQQQLQHDASCPLHVPVARPQGLRGSLTPLLGRRRKKNVVIHRPGVEECTCSHRPAGDQLLRPTPVRPQPLSSGRASSATSCSSETGGTDDNNDDDDEDGSDDEGQRRVGGTMGQRYPPGFDARLRAATPPPAPSGSQIVRSDVATSSDSYEESEDSEDSEDSEESESESEESDEESDEHRRGRRRGEWAEGSTEEEDEEEDRYYIRTEGNRYLPSRLGKGLEVEEEEREHDDDDNDDEDDEEGEEEYSDAHEKPTAAIVRHLLGALYLSTNHKPFRFYLTIGRADQVLRNEKPVGALVAMLRVYAKDPEVQADVCLALAQLVPHRTDHSLQARSLFCFDCSPLSPPFKASTRSRWSKRAGSGA